MRKTLPSLKIPNQYTHVLRPTSRDTIIHPCKPFLTSSLPFGPPWAKWPLGFFLDLPPRAPYRCAHQRNRQTSSRRSRGGTCDESRCDCVPLPLCSCGVLPFAGSLYRQGASRGATSSFCFQHRKPAWMLFLPHGHSWARCSPWCGPPCLCPWRAGRTGRQPHCRSAAQHAPLQNPPQLPQPPRGCSTPSQTPPPLNLNPSPAAPPNPPSLRVVRQKKRRLLKTNSHAPHALHWSIYPPTLPDRCLLAWP